MEKIFSRQSPNALLYWRIKLIPSNMTHYFTQLVILRNGDTDFLGLDHSLAVDSTLRINLEIEVSAVNSPVCIVPGNGIMKRYPPGVRTFWWGNR